MTVGGGSAAELDYRPARRPAQGFIVEQFKPVTKSSLRGFATVTMPSGLRLHDVSVHVSNGRAWASPPARPMLDPNGVALRDASGKIRWQQLIEFSDKVRRDAWSRAVVDAVGRAHPEVLADVAGDEAR